MQHFVVLTEQGETWDTARPMREQPGWADHASFMNSLVDDDFVLLGGPISGGRTHRARLIVRAPDEGAVRERLGADPWAKSGMLRVLSVEPWHILLSKEGP